MSNDGCFDDCFGPSMALPVDMARVAVNAQVRAHVGSFCDGVLDLAAAGPTPATYNEHACHPERWMVRMFEVQYLRAKHGAEAMLYLPESG